VQFVLPADQEKVGDLLNHLQRGGDTADPESVPDTITWLRISPVSVAVHWRSIMADMFACCHE
jgi:hypothetical protein